MSDEYTPRVLRVIRNLPNGDAQVEQLDAVEATNACGVARTNTLQGMQVYQSGKGRTTNLQ